MYGVWDGDDLSGLRNEYFVPGAGLDVATKKKDSSSEFPCVYNGLKVTPTI
jgi:hypothetical protein